MQFHFVEVGGGKDDFRCRGNENIGKGHRPGEFLKNEEKILTGKEEGLLEKLSRYILHFLPSFPTPSPQ